MFKLQVANVQTSNLKIQIFRFQGSSFKLQTSKFRFQLSELKFQTSDFKFQISDFKLHIPISYFELQRTIEDIGNLNKCKHSMKNTGNVTYNAISPVALAIPPPQGNRAAQPARTHVEHLRAAGRVQYVYMNSNPKSI